MQQLIVYAFTIGGHGLKPKLLNNCTIIPRLCYAKFISVKKKGFESRTVCKVNYYPHLRYGEINCETSRFQPKVDIDNGIKMEV